MNLPPFDEFMKAIGEDKIDAIMDSHFNDIADCYNTNDPNFITEIVSKCVTCSVRSSIDLLQAYHNWLSGTVASQSEKKD